jgi:transcriptional regulator with XRE-family HTH domain
MEIISKIDELLREKRVSLDELTRLSGLTRMTIYNARQGDNVTIATALKIARVLDVPVDSIWCGIPVEDDREDAIAS